MKKIIFVAMFLRFLTAITLFCLLSSGSASAQLCFEKISHDFGTIAEDGGAVEQTFQCRNTSTSPIVIVAAKTSCGCTKVEFSRKPIPADSTTTLRVIFNPMNYPGSFARKIVVVTSEGTIPEQLLITGKVTPRQRSIEEEYPIIMGEGIRIATNAHNFGYIEHGRSKQSTFDIVNTSSHELSLRIENPHTELDFYYPTTIAPNQKTTINVECGLAEDSNKYGRLAYTAQLYIGNKIARYPLIVNATAIDFRSENQDNGAPAIALSKNFIKFGTINSSASPQSEMLHITNIGKGPLVVRHIESDNGYFSVSVEGDASINEGESRILRVEINPSKLPFGAVVDRVRIISNAPTQPVTTLRISAIVEK